MIITKEAQERIIDKWNTENKSLSELISFMEGMEAVFAFMEKYKKDKDDFYANRPV